MRIFYICLCLLLLQVNVQASDDTATDAPDVTDAATLSTDAETSTVADTTTETPTTTVVQLIIQNDVQGYSVKRYADPLADMVSDGMNRNFPCASAKFTENNEKYLTPNDQQLQGVCRQNLHSGADNAFIYINIHNDGFKPGYNGDQTYTVGKGWYCCIDAKKICHAEDDQTDAIVPKSSKVPTVKECQNSFDCSADRTCHSIYDERNKKQRDYVISKYGDIGAICCPYFEDKDNSANDLGKGNTCASGTAIKPNPFGLSSIECDNNNKRCDGTLPGYEGKWGICAPLLNGPQKETICCIPKDEDLCPGGLLPIPFHLFKNDTDKESRFRSSYDYNYPIDAVGKKLFENECKSLNDAYEHTGSAGKKCCPKGKQAGNGYIGRYQPELYTLSQKECPCGPDEFCAKVHDATTTAKTLEGKKEMCFKAPKCPSTTPDAYAVFSKNQDHDCNMGEANSCPADHVCVAYSSGLGVCCPESAYNGKCTVASAQNPAVTSPGKAVNLPTAECKSNSAAKLERKAISFDSVDICCEYTSTGGVASPGNTGNTGTSGNAAATNTSTTRNAYCQNNGDYFRDPATNTPMPCTGANTTCGPEKKKTGVCRNTQSGLFCCNENTCPSDALTPMDKLPKCLDDACPLKGKEQSIRGMFCKPNKDGEERCCPLSAKTFTEDQFRGLIITNKMEAQNTGKPCTDVDDCGGYGQMCRAAKQSEKEAPKTCHTPSHNMEYEQTCIKNADCANIGQNLRTWSCVKFRDTGTQGKCGTEMIVVDQAAHEVDKGLLFGAIGCGVGAAVFGLMAIIFFLKYRSKNFCDSRKASKKDKKKKREEKTEGTTGGGTTGGETSGGHSTIGK